MVFYTSSIEFIFYLIDSMIQYRKWYIISKSRNKYLPFLNWFVSEFADSARHVSRSGSFREHGLRNSKFLWLLIAKILFLHKTMKSTKHGRETLLFNPVFILTRELKTRQWQTIHTNDWKTNGWVFRRVHVFIARKPRYYTFYKWRVTLLDLKWYKNYMEGYYMEEQN